MSWVSTNAEAYSGSGATQMGGSLDGSGMVINYGGAASSGSMLPPWVFIAAAAVAVVWLIARKR